MSEQRVLSSAERLPLGLEFFSGVIWVRVAREITREEFLHYCQINTGPTSTIIGAVITVAPVAPPAHHRYFYAVDKVDRRAPPERSPHGSN